MKGNIAFADMEGGSVTQLTSLSKVAQEIINVLKITK